MSSFQVSQSTGEFTLRTNRFLSAYQSFRRWPVIPVFIVVFLVVVAIFAPIVSPHDPLSGDLDDRNVGPAWTEEGTAEFLLGTDHIGRGILSRVIYGARVSILVAVTVLIAGALLGTVVGLSGRLRSAVLGCWTCAR